MDTNDKVSTDDILKFLNELEEKKVEVPRKERSKDNKDIMRFIRRTGLGPGENKVPTYVIYYHFIKWTKTTWTKQWGKEEFFRTFKQYFEQKRSGNQRYYLINDVLDLSKELYEKAKKYNTKWQKRKHTKK